MNLRRLVVDRFLNFHRWLHQVEEERERNLLASQLRSFGERTRIGWPNTFINPQCIELGNRVQIAPYCRVEAVTEYGHSQQRFSPHIKIGDGVSIEMFCHIGANHRVEIGPDVMIAGHVFISDHQHRFDVIDLPVSQSPLTEDGEVIIGAGSFIGEGAIILPNVHLGKHCVVGANSVVNGDFPDGSVLAGVPARLLRRAEVKDS